MKEQLSDIPLSIINTKHQCVNQQNSVKNQRYFASDLKTCKDQKLVKSVLNKSVIFKIPPTNGVIRKEIANRITRFSRSKSLDRIPNNITRRHSFPVNNKIKIGQNDPNLLSNNDSVFDRFLDNTLFETAVTEEPNKKCRHSAGENANIETNSIGETLCNGVDAKDLNGLESALSKTKLCIRKQLSQTVNFINISKNHKTRNKSSKILNYEFPTSAILKSSGAVNLQNCNTVHNYCKPIIYLEKLDSVSNSIESHTSTDLISESIIPEHQLDISEEIKSPDGLQNFEEDNLEMLSNSSEMSNEIQNCGVDEKDSTDSLNDVNCSYDVNDEDKLFDELIVIEENLEISQSNVETDKIESVVIEDCPNVPNNNNYSNENNENQNLSPGKSRYGRTRKPKLKYDFVSVDRKSFNVLNSTSYDFKTDDTGGSPKHYKNVLDGRYTRKNYKKRLYENVYVGGPEIFLPNHINRNWKLGDIVWAKVGEYPYWPCYITMDPETHKHIIVKETVKSTFCLYHVTCCKDNDMHTWVHERTMFHFENKGQFFKYKKILQQKRKGTKSFVVPVELNDLWDSAVKEAESLLAVPNCERIIKVEGNSVSLNKRNKRLKFSHESKCEIKNDENSLEDRNNFEINTAVRNTSNCNGVAISKNVDTAIINSYLYSSVMDRKIMPSSPIKDILQSQAENGNQNASMYHNSVTPIKVEKDSPSVKDNSPKIENNLKFSPKILFETPKQRFDEREVKNKSSVKKFFTSNSDRKKRYIEEFIHKHKARKSSSGVKQAIFDFQRNDNEENLHNKTEFKTETADSDLDNKISDENPLSSDFGEEIVSNIQQQSDESMDLEDIEKNFNRGIENIIVDETKTDSLVKIELEHTPGIILDQNVNTGREINLLKSNSLSTERKCQLTETNNTEIVADAAKKLEVLNNSENFLKNDILAKTAESDSDESEEMLVVQKPYRQYRNRKKSNSESSVFEYGEESPVLPYNQRNNIFKLFNKSDNVKSAEKLNSVRLKKRKRSSNSGITRSNKRFKSSELEKMNNKFDDDQESSNNQISVIKNDINELKKHKIIGSFKIINLKNKHIEQDPKKCITIIRRRFVPIKEQDEDGKKNYSSSVLGKKILSNFNYEQNCVAASNIGLKKIIDNGPNQKVRIKMLRRKPNRNLKTHNSKKRNVTKCTVKSNSNSVSIVNQKIGEKISKLTNSNKISSRSCKISTENTKSGDEDINKYLEKMLKYKYKSLLFSGKETDGASELEDEPENELLLSNNQRGDSLKLSKLKQEKFNNLFPKIKAEKVCQICEKAGDTIRCAGLCNNFYHISCVEKQNKQNSPKKKSKQRGRVKKDKFDKSIQKADSLRVCNDDKCIYSSEDKSEIINEDKNTNFVIEDSSNNLPPNFSDVENKAKELKNNLNSNEEKEDSRLVKRINNIKTKLSSRPSKKSIIKSNDNRFYCNACANGEIMPCFDCGQVNSPKSGDSEMFRCCVASCGKVYHKECLKTWPQATWRTSNMRSHGGGTSSNGSSDAIKCPDNLSVLMCPQHHCHTCISDNPSVMKSRVNGLSLIRCIRCPTSYHNKIHCIPAGCEILTSSQMICPRHYKLPSNSMHINTYWCFICASGGSLICCDLCPTSFHPECLNISPDEYESGYICEDCETGRYPLYGEIVWVKLGYYRWWPAQIMFPNQIPENILKLSHRLGEFVVKFFGSHDHNWVNRGRVFLFHEGDSLKHNYKRNSVDVIFERALEEAHEEYVKVKSEKSARDQEKRNDMKPPRYMKIKTNKPVGNVRILEGNPANLTTCDCDPTSENPCGPDTDCLNRMLMVECNPSVCPAGERCKNQYFEKRLYPPMVPYKTESRGWGLKTLTNIKKGDFVIEYVGEMIDEEEYKRRILRMHKAREENFYFLTIDTNRMLDAGPKGNISRFMNHSCDPNCETQKWTVNGDTRVGLFALKDIVAGTELVFNYNLDSGGAEKKPCNCGSNKCSGFIGGKVADPKKKKVIDGERGVSKSKQVKKLKRKRKKEKNARPIGQSKKSSDESSNNEVKRRKLNSKNSNIKPGLQYYENDDNKELQAIDEDIKKSVPKKLSKIKKKITNGRRTKNSSKRRPLIKIKRKLNERIKEELLNADVKSEIVTDECASIKKSEKSLKIENSNKETEISAHPDDDSSSEKIDTNQNLENDRIINSSQSVNEVENYDLDNIIKEKNELENDIDTEHDLSSELSVSLTPLVL